MARENHTTRDSRKFTIRRPIEDDAASIIQYSKTVFASTDQFLTTPEEYTITVENEKTWINNFNQNTNALVLVSEHNTQIIGLLFFIPNTRKKNSHTGEFGVSVHPDFQRNGIGRMLVDELLRWAKDIRNIEKVYLNVFATNLNAIKLYKDMGFAEEGRHVNAIRQSNGADADLLQMYIETK